MNSKALFNMATCIVCNQPTSPDDLQDVGDMVKLCARLEKVLDEAVPQDSVMCTSCNFDLAQIEMYYTLLTVFKKRYAETAKQRLQSSEGEKSRNVFHETSSYDAENLQSVFGDGNQSGSSSTHLSMYSDIMTENSSPEISTPLDILDAQTVKVELDASLPVSSPGTSIGTLDEHPQPIPFAFSSPVRAPKKHGRARKSAKSSDVFTSSLASYPKKRGRPRKNAQTTVVPRNISVTKKQGRRNKPSASVSAVHAKKRGRPRKSDSSINSHSLGSAVAQPGEWEPLTSMGGEVELADCNEVKTESHETAVENALGDGGSVESKTKKTKSSKDQDLSCTDSAHKPAGKRKQRQPKRVVGPRPSLICPICNKVIVDKHTLQVHMKCHSDERPHTCPVCGKGFKFRNNLTGHMKIHTAEKPFKCEICSKAFIRRTYLDRHSLVHTDSLPFPCDQCDKRFKSQDRQRVHIKLAHVQGKRFLCNICGLGLYTAGTLRVHLLTHNDVKPFQCQTCGKRCATKQTLKNHELSHTEGARTKHLCPTCGKSFKNKSYLATHMQLHTGESKHFCNICNKAILSGSAYRVHMLIHQDLKPHQCSECGKKFRVKIHLKQHMMSHSDERPFKCACGQAFRQKGKLDRHMRTKIHAEFEAKSIPVHTGILNVPLAPADLPEGLPVGPPVPVVVAPLPRAPTLPIVAPLGMGSEQDMVLAYHSNPV